MYQFSFIANIYQAIGIRLLNRECEDFLPLNVVFHQQSCSIKSCLLIKVFTQGCLLSKVVFHQRLLPQKVVFPCRSSTIEACLINTIPSIEKKNGCSQSKLQSHATTTELTGTDKQAGAQDHLLCQADALTKNVDLPLFDKSNFDVTTFLIQNSDWL